MLAMAKIVDGDISELFSANDCSNSTMVVFKPAFTSQKRSVFAVHNRITWSTPDFSLKSLPFGYISH